jgi:putative ABC transport system permease protein
MNPAHPLLAKAVPVSVGDNFNGFRIVGTTADFPQLYTAQLSQGNLFATAMDACIGDEVSKKTGLRVGDEFYSEHGLIKGDGENNHGQKFRVCGIFSPGGTVLDQLILTPLESIWMVHEEHSEVHEEREKSITALLLKYRNRSNFQALNLPRNINENTDLQAAVPAMEMNRLYVLLGNGEKMLRMLAFAIILVSGFSIFLALLNALKERKSELALLRVMGASGYKLFALILTEAGILAVVGSICGFALSHSAMLLFSRFVKNAYRYHFDAFTFLPSELVLFAIALMIGLVSGIIPALLAYRTRVTAAGGQN